MALSFTATFADALDYPHTDIGVSTPVNCGDCHYSHGDPPWKPTAPVNIDETFYNNLCLSCHDSVTATDVKTHSSIQVDGGYRDWSIECWKCHDAHEHEQFDDHIPDVYIETGTVGQILLDTPIAGETTLRDAGKNWTTEYDQRTDAGAYTYFYIAIPNTAEPYYTYRIKESNGTDLVLDGNVDASKVTEGASTYAIVYGRLIRGTIDAPDMDTCEVIANEFICSSTTPKTVRYFNITGANSMADGDVAFDSVCEVCHTKTTYHRNDNTGRVHNATQDCTACHKHVTGFEINPATMDAGAECNNCHGFPPVDGSTLVGFINPSSTGSTSAGAHDKHANLEGIGCGYCHIESAGYGATHNSGNVVTMGFSMFTGSFEGGTYSGQSGVTYDATNTSPLTNVSSGGATTCSNVYCHSIVQSAVGGALTPDTADYATPNWTGAVQCGECHKADGVQGNATLMDSGTHSKHTALYACVNCHDDTGKGDLHVNGIIDVNFDATLNPYGTYSQSPDNTPGGGYGSCSTLFCHGTGTAANPTWGDSAVFKCGDCHLVGTGDTDDFTFDNGTMARIDSSQWSDSGHGRTTGTYDVSTNTAANLPGAAGTGDACLYCHDSGVNHGNGTNPFRLKDHADGNGWNDVCLKCHKTGSTGYDPPGSETLKTATVKINKYHDSTKYDTSPRDGGSLCFDCHDPHGDRASGSGNIMMIHNSVTVNKADVYGTPSTTASPDFQDKNAGDGNDFAKEDPGSPGNYIGICQVCHYLTGNHRADGSGNQGHNLTNAPGCTQSGCHLHDYDQNINSEAFFLAVSGDSCSDCHSSAGGPTAGTAPDAGHANHIQTAYVGTLSSGDYGNYTTNNWYEFTNVGGNPDMKCGNCHPQSIATHANGSKNLYFDPGDKGADGTVKALNDSVGPWYSGSGNSVTCSAVYCHSTGYKNPATGNYYYVDSPLWGTGLFTEIAEDRCAGCHGNSPNSTDSVAGPGQRVGSLSHYNPDFMGLGVTGGHFVGIHYDNVYTGTTGLAVEGATGDDSHGNSAYSTTINCNSCHNATVTSTANDMNEVCFTCHDPVGGTATSRGNMDIAAGSTVHVNGTADVAFDTAAFRSKAQIRNDITVVPELNDSWTRSGGYKVTNAFDQGPLSSASYSSGTCSTVACHNGYDVAWDDQKLDCFTCHRETTN